jgi:[pyruvate, water dikinase]-phosphate phosphotransferase / [pyruvate, water dikinase] kinase
MARNKAVKSSKQKVQVFIISDATGLTAEMVISAALVQFREIDPIFKKFPYIKTKEQVSAIFSQAEAVRGIVIYSLVSQELRSWILREKRKKNVFAVDILGPLIDQIGKIWNLIPSFSPGLLKRVSEESIRLAESIDFTLRHDDGQRIETIEQADLILFGVSRTSKTPTSLYLSCNHTLKVANVPIIEGIIPPEKLYTLGMQKVGLTIAPERLAFIRERRMKYAGVTDYLDVSHIRRELEYSHRIFNRIQGVQIIDVTHSSIEEVANKIIERRQESEKEGKEELFDAAR